VETVDGQRFLLLKHGQRIETRLATGEKTRSVFETARILVGDAPSEETTTDLARNRPTWALLDSGEASDRAELVWRVGTVWAALNLVLVALVSKSDQVRRANAWTLVWALLVFVVYFNLQSLAQSWVGSGKIGDRAGLFGLHGGVMLLALLALWWRDGGWRQSRPVKGQT
jgi:lipopolysaccharide export system permease protein